MAKFEKGQSGNPNGRPKGSSRVNELRKQLYSRSDELIDSVIDAAIAGDMSAMKMCLDRVLPLLKPQENNCITLTFDSDLPQIDTNKKISEQINMNELTVPQLHDFLHIIKLKADIAEAERKDDCSVEEKRWDNQFSHFDYLEKD